MDDTALLAAIDAAAREVASARGLDAVLSRLADLSRELTGAPYAAVGLPDGAGGFERFVTAGMDDDTIAAIGWLPRVHGILGAMLEDTEPELVDDVTADGRFDHFPEAHPVMRSLLGVPIVRHGELVGAFYVSDEEAGALGDADLEAVARLAPHAAVAIANAHVDELLRERSMREERDRLARDLHDAVTQRVLGLRLAIGTATDLMEADPEATRIQLASAEEAAEDIARELRSLVDQLRPPDLRREGLAGALAKHADLVGRGADVQVAVHVDASHPLDPQTEAELLRIGQEALSNAIRHGAPSRVDIDLVTGDDVVTLAIRDDGRGIDQEALARDTGQLGLKSMRARAERSGGRLRIDATPEGGTSIVAEIRRQQVGDVPEDTDA